MKSRWTVGPGRQSFFIMVNGQDRSPPGRCGWETGRVRNWVVGRAEYYCTLLLRQGAMGDGSLRSLGYRTLPEEEMSTYYYHNMTIRYRVYGIVPYIA